jgi:hypothetical protein
MKIYKVKLSLLLVMHRLKRYDLGRYNYDTPIIFVDAKDPDGACHAAVYGLFEIMYKQDSSIETKLLFRELAYDIRVIKVYNP